VALFWEEYTTQLERIQAEFDKCSSDAYSFSGGGTPMSTAIGMKIRQARERYGMSQAELARRIGISKTAMNDLEQGKTRDPHLSRIVAIADQLRLSVDTLVGRHDPDDTPVTKRPRSRKAAPVG
jgi:DNA-binding XRE family transcriptional regulator